MKHKLELSRYIEFKRRAGLSDEIIRESLSRRGWSVAALTYALDTSLIARDHPVTSDDASDVARTAVSLKHPLAHKLIPLFVAVLVLSGGLVFSGVLHPRSATTRPKTVTPYVVNDANYQLTLPPGWRASGDYSNGAGVNVFTPVKITSSLGKSQMTIFVLPQQAGESYDAHINRQLQGLIQNGGRVETLRVDKVTFAGELGEIRQITSAPPSDPGALTYHVYGGVVYGQTVYSVDVVVPADQWSTSQAAVLKSVKSFAPKNQSVTTKHRP